MVNTCFTDKNCERDGGSLYGHSGMLCAVRGYDGEAQGLVCLLDGNWGSLMDRSSYLGCHFGLFEYGSEYVSAELSPGFSSPANMFYGKSAITEWKWILSRRKASICNSASKDKFEENMDIFLDTDVKKDAMKITTEFSSISICCAPLKSEGCPCAGIRKPQRVHMIPSAASNAPLLSHKSPLWNTSKGHACVENSQMCPTTRPRDESSKWCGYCRRYTDCDLLVNGHVTSSRSADSCSPPSPDQFCLASCLREGEPSALENTLSTMSTMGLSHSTPPCGHLSGVTELSVIQSAPLQPSTHKSLRVEKTTWETSNEECFDATNQEYEILGKALCHAQTRARLAEKHAARVMQEREMLELLLLREVWTTFTYRQRAQTLELENRLLKLCLEINVEVSTGSETLDQCGLVEQRARTSGKFAQKRCRCRYKMIGHLSSSCQNKDCNVYRSRRRSILLSCVLGLAFVLGMSFAGAGFMMGWSMSRMLFS